MIIPFVGPAYKTTKALSISAQSCVNWYLEQNAPGSRSEFSLRPTPGLVEWADLGTNRPVTNIHPMGEFLYAISDRALYRVNPAGTSKKIGDVYTDAERITMADNGTQVMGSDNNGAMIYTVAGGLQPIVDTDFPGSPSICFFDGYFVYVFNESNKFGVSALNNGFSYDALQYASAEGSPDNLVACINDHRQLWLFGESTVEVWYNTGSAYFPFNRYGGAFIELGCAARYSPAKIDNTVFWLGDDLAIHRAVDFRPIRISTHAIEKEISSYQVVNDAFGYAYSQSGHSFYVLTFPTAKATWVYDAATGMWHERKSYGIGRHRGNCYAKFKGKNLLGDYANGKIYYMDHDVFTDDGDPIIRERATQVISADEYKIFMANLQVMFEQGVGLVNGQGEFPRAMLQWSDDGGKTWSSEQWASIGQMGDYDYRSIWRRLGSFRQRVFRLRISDPVNAVVNGAVAKLDRER